MYQDQALAAIGNCPSYTNALFPLYEGERLGEEMD